MQDFGGEGSGTGSQYEKCVRGFHLGKILKNLHAIWFIILHLLQKKPLISFFFVLFFYLFFSNFFLFFSCAGVPQAPMTAPLLCTEMVGVFLQRFDVIGCVWWNRPLAALRQMLCLAVDGAPG